MFPPMLQRSAALILALVAAASAPAAGDGLSAVEGTDTQGRSLTEIVAGRPAVVLLTSPRVADVGAGLRLLTYLENEIGNRAEIAVVIYGEKPASLKKYQEGMPFPVIAGEGELGEAVLGEGGKIPQVLLVSDEGLIAARKDGVPDPALVAETLNLRYAVGDAGPPSVGTELPALLLPATEVGAQELNAAAKNTPKAIYYLFAANDPAGAAHLDDLQRLADDAGEDTAVVPILIYGGEAVAKKLSESGYIDLPILIGGPLTERRLIGAYKLPLLIETQDGKVIGVKAEALVPTRWDILVKEAVPATEGEPLELKIRGIFKLQDGIRAAEAPHASFDALDRRVVFSGHFAEGDVDHLYEITASGKKLRQISYAPAPDRKPACSPDAVHIAFVSGRSGGSEIWVCERERGEFTKITSSGGAFDAPVYSADGRWLVAARRIEAAGGANLDLWLMTPRGRRLRPILQTFDDEAEPAFAPDGTGVYYAGRREGRAEIYYCDLKGGRRRRLTDPDTEARMPAPSPDGKYIVYAARTPGEPFKLWAMNIDGSSKTPLTTGEGNDLAPSFNPAGDSLVFTSDRSGSYGIYKLTFEPVVDYEQPRPPRRIKRRI